MKKAKEFFSRHPILEMLAFNTIAFPIAIGIGLLIRHYSNFDFGTIIFAESLFVLMICYSCVNGNADSRMANTVYDRKILAEHDYYLGAYHFAIKYGILGVSLFLASGFFGMR